MKITTQFEEKDVGCIVYLNNELEFKARKKRSIGDRYKGGVVAECKKVRGKSVWKTTVLVDRPYISTRPPKMAGNLVIRYGMVTNINEFIIDTEFVGVLS